jgi:hypothetical protein
VVGGGESGLPKRNTAELMVILSASGASWEHYSTPTLYAKQVPAWGSFN